MKEVDIEDAQINLLMLIEQAVRGEAFVITRWGGPLVTVQGVPSALHEPLPRLGFLAGAWTIPDDFDAMNPEIEKLFYGDK